MEENHDIYIRSSIKPEEKKRLRVAWGLLVEFLFEQSDELLGQAGSAAKDTCSIRHIEPKRDQNSK